MRKKRYNCDESVRRALTRLLQECYKDVTRILQECYKGVYKHRKAPFVGDPFDDFREGTRGRHGCQLIESITKVSQECYSRARMQRNEIQQRDTGKE
jgi:hypothetical protein